MSFLRLCDRCCLSSSHSFVLSISRITAKLISQFHLNIGPTSRKNSLTFGGDPVLYMDFGSLFQVIGEWHTTFGQTVPFTRQLYFILFYFANNWPLGDCLQRLWFDIVCALQIAMNEWMNEWKSESQFVNRCTKTVLDEFSLNVCEWWSFRQGIIHYIYFDRNIQLQLSSCSFRNRWAAAVG